MKKNKRKIVVKLIESDKVHNQRLAEYFAQKFNERGLKNGRV